MINPNKITDQDTQIKVCETLSNESRLKILILLQKREMNINELAQALGISVSAATISVQKLESAGLVKSITVPGQHGMQKKCSAACNGVFLDFNPENTEELTNVCISMPIGQYVKCEAHPTCGLVTEKEKIGPFDDITAFYHTDHVQAQLIWLVDGYLEYQFQNKPSIAQRIERLELSAEVCSEVKFYNNKLPSEITVWINGHEIGTAVTAGDYGGRRGKYTPGWWHINKTQYGELRHWVIDSDGCRVDEMPSENLTIDDLHLDQRPYIEVKIGIKKENYGKAEGMNIFGHAFGDYPQDINLNLVYRTE